jgi:uncharacterized protein YutD
MKSEKYWYKLLNHFERNGYFENGLTIPFIIGSRKFIEPEQRIQTVQELIFEFSNSDCFINVLKCDLIGEYVFRISDTESKKIYGGIENFVIIDNSFFGFKNHNEIAMELEKLYNDIIKGEKFSKINGEWQSFDLKEDILKIKEIK